MALNKTLIDVPFTSGVNNKLDDKLVSGSTLLTLENGIFTKGGRINKRSGYTQLSNKISSGTQLSNFKALMTFGEDELLLAAGQKMYSYSDSNDVWVDKGNFVSASVGTKPIVTNAAQQTAMDFCEKDNIALYAWNDSRGGIRYSVQDTSSGVYYITDVELTSSGDTPRCVVIGANLFVFYAESTNLKFMYVQVSQPATVTTGTTKADLHTDHLLSVISIGNNGYIWYKSSTATTGILSEVDGLGAEVATGSVTATIIDTLELGSMVVSGLTYIFAAYKETTSLVNCGIYSQSLVELVAPTAIDSTATADVSKITMHRTNSTTDSMTFLYQIPGSSVKDDLVNTNTLTLTGTAGTASVFVRSVGLASKIFSYLDELYVAVLHESSLQSTVFIINQNLEIVGKYAAGNAGTHAGVGAFLPSVGVSGDMYNFLMNAKGSIRSENATIFSQLGIYRSTIDFLAGNTYDNTSINKNFYTTGGILNLYDGDSVTEQGFNVFPEDVTVTSTPATAGSMSDGTYQYVAVYQWIDSKGNTHKSAPSIPLTQVLSGGGSAQRVVLSIPTLRLTKKTSPRAEATIEVFRTVTTGSIFYRVSSITSPTDNDPTADTISFNDTLADASITANEILYTTGSVLDNIAAPSSDIITNHTNRVFLAGLQDKNEIRYSKIVRNGEGVSFNEALSIPVDPRGGNITALSSMDSNLIVFKRDDIYVISGGGPSDTGAGSTFTEPSLIASDVGAIDSKSIILGPQGLYFKSTKGIYLLSRSLQTTYIGSPVEDFNNLEVVSSKLLDDVNEVRFATSNGTTLVFNYYFQQWSVFKNQYSVDTVTWNSGYVFATVGGEIWSESSTSFLDSGSSIPLKLSTGWIKVSGIQGFQRAYRASILGEFKTRHKLRVNVYVDYATKIVQTAEFTTNEILSIDSDFYGDGTYGVSTPYGSSDNGVYQFQIHLKKQKCQAIRFEILDLVDNSTDFGTGESLSLTGVSVQVGRKRGNNKVGTTKSK